MSNNVGKNISKNLCSKYSHKLQGYGKQSSTDALRTAWKRAIQKTAEVTVDLIGNKIVDKIINVSRTSAQNSSEIENNVSSVVVWDREDYIKQTEKRLGDEEVCEEVSNDATPLLKTIDEVIAKIRKPSDLKNDNLDYFIMKDLNFARFYLLPKIHKRLHNVPGRPVISNSGYYTENISSFLDHHLQPLAQAVKSYIKDTN